MLGSRGCGAQREANSATACDREHAPHHKANSPRTKCVLRHRCPKSASSEQRGGEHVHACRAAGGVQKGGTQVHRAQSQATQPATARGRHCRRPLYGVPVRKQFVKGNAGMHGVCTHVHVHAQERRIQLPSLPAPCLAWPQVKCPSLSVSYLLFSPARAPVPRAMLCTRPAKTAAACMRSNPAQQAARSRPRPRPLHEHA